jgi:hypothetical protein
VNLEQTGVLLAEVQMIDNRRVDDATLLYWHGLIGDLGYAESSEAVRMHRQERPGVYLEPGHVRANVDRIRRAVPAPTDDFGNALPTDGSALDAQRRLTARSTRAVTS